MATHADLSAVGEDQETKAKSQCTVAQPARHAGQDSSRQSLLPGLLVVFSAQRCTVFCIFAFSSFIFSLLTTASGIERCTGALVAL